MTPNVERLGQTGSPARPSAFAFDLATVRVLCRRDLVRFFRQKSRIVGALAQPLIFWGMMGSGFAPSTSLISVFSASVMVASALALISLMKRSNEAPPL